jgi:hypothetical protein
MGRASRRHDKPPTTTLSRADREWLVRILPAIVGSLGSETFTSEEALEICSVKLVAKGFTTRKLGRLLARAAGKPIDGYLVEDLGRGDSLSPLARHASVKVLRVSVVGYFD